MVTKVTQKKTTSQPGSKSAKQNQDQLDDEPYILYQKSANKSTKLFQYSFMDIICHSFLSKILTQGLREPFNFNHMYQLPKSLEYHTLKQRIKEMLTPEWREKIISRKSTIYHFYHRFLGNEFKFSVFLRCLSDVVIIFIPMLLREFINWIEEEGERAAGGGVEGHTWRGVTIVGLISLTLIGSKLFLFIGRFYLHLMQTLVRGFTYVSLRR